MIPGEVRVGDEPLELNAGRDRLELVIINEGDRPIQIGSHLHLPDANPALRFDREAAEGYRLDIPSGTSVRLEPGVSRTVPLVRLAGRRYVPGAQLPHRASAGRGHEEAP
ncbi:MAG: urease subunit beta [Trebonia sp.]